MKTNKMITNSYVEVELKDKKFAFGSNKIYKVFNKIVTNEEVYDFYKEKDFTDTRTKECTEVIFKDVI
jgi:hypothetical protein